MKKEITEAVNLIKKAVEDGIIPSAALAIGCKDELYVKECFGHVSELKDAPAINSETVYDMASMSKILATTMIVFKLIDEGRFTLEDTLELYVEKGYLNSEDVPKERRNITLYNLLTHTSGIEAHFMLWNYIEDEKDAVKFILNQPLAYETGKGQQYTCMGYIVLGKILEGYYKEGLDVIAKREVFEPLGMKNTGYHPIKEGYKALHRIEENTAYTEKDSYNDEWLAGTVHDENARFLHGVAGNAGVFSTLDDVIRFSTMLSNGGVLEGKRFISEGLFAEAIKNHTEGCGQNRGLGFHLPGEDCYSGDLFDRKAFGHTGFTGTHFLISPTTGLYVIMLTNRVHPNRDAHDEFFDVRHKLHDILTPLSLM